MAAIRRALYDKRACGEVSFIECGRHITYAALFRRASAVQARLPREGGSNIALYLPNGADFAAALYGILAGGMTAMPLNTALTAHEIEPLLAQASVGAVVTNRAHGGMFEDIARSAPMRVILMDDLVVAEQSPPPSPAQVREDAPMLLLATSGTTGLSKIVQLSERNIASSTLAFIDKMDYGRFPQGTIRMALGTPYASVYGIMMLTVCPLLALTVVVIGDISSPDILFRAVQAHRVTHFEGGVSVGLMMDRMAGRPVGYDIGSLKYMGLAGSDLPADVLRRLMDAYPGIEFWPGYGMTEAGPLIAKPDKRVNPDKLASVGTKISCAEVKIDVGGTLTDAPRAVGEIAVRGPGVMLGYYRDEEATRRAIRDGFLYTGDVGYFDEDGYLYICGRKKNVIIVRGLNVHAEEVEACIMSSGLARDCAVSGEPDPQGGERVRADIVPASPDTRCDDIRRYLWDRLARYKQPHTIRFTHAIGKTATGKTERH